MISWILMFIKIYGSSLKISQKFIRAFSNVMYICEKVRYSFLARTFKGRLCSNDFALDFQLWWHHVTEWDLFLWGRRRGTRQSFLQSPPKPLSGCHKLEKKCPGDAILGQKIINPSGGYSIHRMSEWWRGCRKGQTLRWLVRAWYFDAHWPKNMESHVLGFFMKNIVFHTYPGIVEYKHTV